MFVNFRMNGLTEGLALSVCLVQRSLINVLRAVPTNSKVFLHGLLNIREKQILTSVIEIQKENWG